MNFLIKWYRIFTGRCECGNELEVFSASKDWCDRCGK